MKTVEDMEEQVAEMISDALAGLGLMPKGYHCEVRLHGKQRDKRRSATFEKNWSPDTDSIKVRFQRTPGHPKPGSRAETAETTASNAESTSESSARGSDPVSDLVRALDRAESRPGYEFVALKWFRDTALLEEGFAWVSEYSSRQAVLREAIEKRLILTSKVPNPKSPQFPVTAIRLNRLMPEVKAILGEAGNGMPDFDPVPIRGASLSQTILNERR